MDEFYGRGRATLSNIAYPAAPASTLDPTRLKGLRVIFRFQVTLGASILFFLFLSRFYYRFSLTTLLALIELVPRFLRFATFNSVY